MPEKLEGLVIGRAPGYFVVRTDEGATRLCTIRGKLRRARLQSRRPSPPPSRIRTVPASANVITPPEPEEADIPVIVAVGDRVQVTPDGTTGGAIDAILPRHNKLSRAAIESTEEQILLANLDQVVLVFAIREPTPHFGLLDRYLVVTEDSDIPAIICFTKIDLGVPDEVLEGIRLYESLGYRIIQTSTVWHEGIATLHDLMEHHVTLLTGPSGVGKSTLLNIIEPTALQRVGEISLATGKGKHTTTGVRLFPLSNGGWLADSAGIREFAPWGIVKERLPAAFVEFRPYLGHCAFDDCDHDENATGCAIHSAVDEGKIAVTRYESYLRLLDEIPKPLDYPKK